MNKKSGDGAAAEPEESMPDSVRERLGNSPSLQAAADSLLQDLAALNNQAGPSKAGEEMLSFIINEVQKGADIPNRFPTFYRKLLENEMLRGAFLDALELTSKDEAGKLTPLPRAARADLEFLVEQRPHAKIEIETGGWRVEWERTVNQLRRIFFPMDEAVFRAGMLFEEPLFVLLRDEIVVESNSIAISLEGTLSDEGDSLDLSLKVALEDTTPGRVKYTALRADLRWGEYHSERGLHQDGRATFPAVRLSQFLNEGQSEINEPIVLTLANKAR